MESRGYEWPAISCVAAMWTFAEDPQIVTVRRAVRQMVERRPASIGNPNFTGASAPSVNIQSDASAADVLYYIEEANNLVKTGDRVLRDLVSEAYVRGATWADIGRVLGVGGTAAQKRFRTPDRERLLHLNSESSTAFSLWDAYVYGGPISGDRPPGDRFMTAVLLIVSCAHSIEKDIHGVADSDPESWESLQYWFETLCDALLLTIMPTPIVRCIKEWSENAKQRSELDRESNAFAHALYFIYQALRAQQHLAMMFDLMKRGSSEEKEKERHPIFLAIKARNCLRAALGAVIPDPGFRALLDVVPVSEDLDSKELLYQLLTDAPPREEDDYM